MNSQVVARPFESGGVADAIYQYFEALNRFDLNEVSALFEETGCLIAPMDVRSCGREAIATYLRQECQGMTLYPQSFRIEGASTIVSGRVRCPAFWVNAEWIVQLNQGLISRLRVRLVTSLQEMIVLREQVPVRQEL